MNALNLGEHSLESTLNFISRGATGMNADDNAFHRRDEECAEKDNQKRLAIPSARFCREELAAQETDSSLREE
jgi:hypothetical protein